MHDSPELLAKRLAGLGPKDKLQGFFIASGLKVLARELGEAEAARIVSERQLEPKPINFFRYPTRNQLELMLHGGQAISKKKGMPFDAAVARLSEGVAATFFDSPAGKTLVSLSNATPNGVLAVAPVAFSTVASHGTRVTQKVGPNESARLQGRAAWAFVCRGPRQDGAGVRLQAPHLGLGAGGLVGPRLHRRRTLVSDD